MISASNASTMQVEHQLDVLVEGLRDAHRRFGNVDLVRRLARWPSESAVRFRGCRQDIRSDARAVAGSSMPCSRATLSVSESRMLRSCRLALDRRCCVSCCRRRTAARTLPADYFPWAAAASRSPGNGVEISAAVARAAIQADFFNRQFDRRQRRVLADVRGRHLIERGARRASNLSPDARRSGTPRPSAHGRHRRPTRRRPPPDGPDC